MSWEGIPNTQGYGERGIINAVVRYINQDEKYRIERLQQFLGAIKWGNEAETNWIKTIHDFKIVVELKLSEFGDPDLIIVCKYNSNKFNCIFVEAKVHQYKKSMQSNTKRMRKGFNSSINGQLSLKYRFTTALETPRCKDNSLSEPNEIYGQYKKFGDSIGRPRKICKLSIIEILETLGLRNIDLDMFFFVAWTWDDDDHIFFNDPEVTKYDNNDRPVGMPLFFNKKGEYIELKERLGWLGYNNLEKDLSLNSFPEYVKARKTMIPQSTPDQDDKFYDLNKLNELKKITRGDFNQFENNIAELSGDINKIFKNNKCFICKEHKVTYSIKFRGIVVAKIIPQDKFVFVGFRIILDDVALGKNVETDILTRNYDSNFYEGLKITSSSSDEEKEEMEEFIKERLCHIITRDK